MEESAGPAPSGAEPGAFARVAGAVFSPVRTFESIARRPTWFLPLLLWTAVSLGMAAVYVPKMDWERMMRSRMERSGQTIPQERMEQIVESQKKIGGAFTYGVSAVLPAVVSLLVTLVFWGAFKAFGWDTTFRQSFGATTHAFLPAIVGGLLMIPILTNKESVDPSAMGDYLRSNPGFLVEQDSSKFLHSLLQSFDIFSIWSLILFIIGFSAAAKVSRSKAASVIVTLWFVYVLGKSSLTALF